MTGRNPILIRRALKMHPTRTFASIAREFGVSDAAVAYHAKNFGFVSPYTNRKLAAMIENKRKREARAAIQELERWRAARIRDGHAAGMTRRAMIDAFNVSKSTVDTIIARLRREAAE
jgi:Zn-dependent peptidase ImmA (M78 family)